MGQMHAAGLHLIATGIIALKVADRTKIGTNKVRKEHLIVFCPNEKRVRNGEEYCRPGFTVDCLREGFNVYSATSN